jgi:DNA-binding HxlR family transcriptional regulator
MNENMQDRKLAAASMVEYIVGCKWSMQILNLISQGVNRPGAITKSIDGISTKVQNDCLSKMVGFGILDKFSYPEIPPRVEYKLTKFGEQFMGILDAIANLQKQIDSEA